MIIIKILILCIVSITLFIISFNKIRNNNSTKSSTRTSTYKALSPQVSQNIKSCFSPKIVSIPEIDIDTSLLREIKATELIPILKDMYYEYITYKWEILPEDINPDANEKIRCSDTSTCFSIFNNLSKTSSILFSSSTLIIPKNVFNKNMRLRLLLEVNVNNNKFTSERILNIKNNIPTVVINPSFDTSQDASSPITIYNKSYLNYSYPVEYNINKWLPVTNLTYYYFDYNSRSKNFITSTWSFAPSNGIMVNSNRIISPTDESLTISSYRFIPKTSNKVDVTLTVKNKDNTTYFSTKTIPIYLTINLANKFDFLIINPNHFSGQPLSSNIWDRSQRNTFTLSVQLTEKVSADIHPLRSDLIYNWSVIDYYSRNPINIISIGVNTSSSSLTLTYNSNVFSTDKCLAMCTISYGLYSTPVNLRFEIIIPPPPNLANKFDFSIINPNSSVDPFSGIRIDNVWDPTTRNSYTLDVRLTEKISADIPPLRTDLIYNWIVINSSGNSINISSVASNTTSSSLTLSYNSNVFPTTTNQYIAKCTITYGDSPPVNLSFIFYVVPSPIDCRLSDWGACSATCDGGTQERTILRYPNSTGRACPPESDLTRSCNTQPCPIDCIVSDQWGECSSTCGGGTQRKIITQNPNSTGRACPPESDLTRSCNIQPCPVNLDDKFSFLIRNPNPTLFDPLSGQPIGTEIWDPVTRNSYTLDVRLTEKINADIPPLRSDLIYNWIVINNNSGNPINISSVASNTTSSSITLTYNSSVFPITNNQYTARCTITYGVSPPVNLSFIFYVVPSPPINCALSDWGACSATCGGGTQTRTITQNPNSIGNPCPTVQTEYLRSCNTQPCPIDCALSDWGACSATCGGGTQTRTITRYPNETGKPCPETVQNCNTQPCPINCILSEWTPCSATCGGGTQTRRILQFPNETGIQCPTNQSDYIMSCNTQSCGGGGGEKTGV